MFGYVTIHRDELKIKDYNRYRGYYCGICRSLRCRYGISGQMTLNYDMVFVAMLLTGLYEGKESVSMRRCVFHPTEKHMSISSKYIDYAADMTVILTYYNLLDDWYDDKNPAALTEANLLRKNCAFLREKYPRQWKSVLDYIESLNDYERENGDDLDTAARFTGEMLGELLVYKEDEWSVALRTIGFYLGKFIYLSDAYEDIEKDEKKGSYNPLLCRKDDDDFEKWFESVLTMMMAECARQFECLPILKDVDILRNILYSGVWSRYNMTVSRRA